MCGITMLIDRLKKGNALSYVLKSLEQLQNRGYDSFGVSYLAKDVYKTSKICINESSDDIFNIFHERNKNIKTNIALGHSRWATHGKISNNNAHPHISMNNIFCCVHNGIIENYIELKTKLTNEGYIFYSETDTEVIINLVEYYYKQYNDVEKSIKQVIDEVAGTYGLIICDMRNSNFYIIRNGSPLLLGINEEFIMITSENRGFLNLIKHYYNLKENDLIIIKNGNVIVDKFDKLYECNNTCTELGDYNHYTLKEIDEQSNTLLMSLNNGARLMNNSVKLGGIEYLLSYVEDIKNIVFLGCGTSFYACNIGMRYFKKFCMDVNYFVYDGGEFTLKDIPSNGLSLFVFCSQSGETMDLIQQVDMLRKMGELTMGIINVIDSTIAKKVDCGIYLNVGKEIAVASTKSFTSTLLILKLFSIWMYQYKKGKNLMMMNSIKDINSLVLQIKEINSNYENIVKNIDYKKFKNNIFILGKGKMEFIAKECSLKMKEICYIHAEGYSGSSLKHGPFALLDDNFYVILLVDRVNKVKMMNVYNQIRSRNVSILVITDDNSLDVDDKIVLPENDELQDIIFIVFLQKLIYNISINRGINPDKPKNLAKVVTVY